MLKKVISCLLILSMLGYLGCSGFDQITKKEFVKGYTEENDRSGINVTTKDSTLYQFQENQYKVEANTLYGAGKINKPIKDSLDGFVGEWIGFHGKIALEDILYIEKESIDYLSTSLFVIGIVSVLFFLIALSSLDTGMGGFGFRMPME